MITVRQERAITRAIRNLEALRTDHNLYYESTELHMRAIANDLRDDASGDYEEAISRKADSDVPFTSRYDDEIAGDCEARR